MIDCPAHIHHEWRCEETLEYFKNDTAYIHQADVGRGHHPDHMIIVPYKKMSALAKTISVANSILVDDLKYPATYIIGALDRTFEVIPRGVWNGCPNECNLQEKLAMMDYCLFKRGATLLGNPSISGRELNKRLVIHLKMNTSLPVEPAATFVPFARSLTHVREGFSLLVEKLEGETSGRKYIAELMNKVKYLLVYVIPEKYETQIQECAFCSEKVLHDQMVYEGKKCQVLYNFKPWSANHFMVVTKEHKPHWQMLTEEEQKEILQLGEAVGRAIQVLNPQAQVEYVIQNGTAAGQTQPHTHMHVLSIPSRIDFLVHLVEEVLSQKKPLRPYEMYKKRHEYEALIASYLE